MPNGTFAIESTQCITPGGGVPSLSWALTENGTTASGIVGGFANCDVDSNLTKNFSFTAEGGNVDLFGQPLTLTVAHGDGIAHTFNLPSGRDLTITGTAENFTVSADVLPFTFTLALSVTNSCGFTSSISAASATLKAPPAFANFTYASPSDGVYDFTDTSNDGGCTGGGPSRTWNVPGKVEGVDYSFTNSTTSTSPNPQITFASYGTYTVRLEFVTACGVTKNAIKAISYQNAAPEAQSVSVSGSFADGQTLTGTYTYFDSEGDLEGSTSLRWYRSDDAACLVNKVQVSSGLSYTVTSSDVGKYICWEVIPAASTGTLTGTPTKSTPGLVGTGVATIHDEYHDSFHS